MTRPLDRLRAGAAETRLHQALDIGDGPAATRALGDLVPPLRRLATADPQRWAPKVGAAVAAYLNNQRRWSGPPAPEPHEITAADVATVLTSIATTESWSSSRRALAAAHEAVAVARTIPATDGEQGRAVLAAALTALARCLSDQGRHARAARTAGEALELYREMEPGSPHRTGMTEAHELHARNEERRG